jgi:hypothetical protein
MNRESLLALTCRSIEALVQAGALVAVIYLMNPVQQGMYISFLSFAGLMQLFDFGLAYAALQTSGHFAVRGDRRLKSLFSLSMRIALWASLAGGVLIGLIGYALISRGAGALGGSWVGPWFCFVTLLGLVQLFALAMTLYEGSTSVVSAWRMRVIQEAVGGAALIAALIAGFGLWSLSAWLAGRLLVMGAWFFAVAQREYHALDVGDTGFRLEDWRREIWPFQWKIGLSSIAGYAIFRSMTVIVLAVRGPEDAGRFGLSLAVMNMLLAVTTVWPYSQVRRYGELIVRRDIRGLLDALRPMVLGSTALAFLLACLFCSLQYVALMNGWSFAARMGDISTNMFLMATALVHHGIACFAVVLRAEQKDPLLPVSLGGGLALVLAISLAARFGDLADVAAVNFLVSMTGIPFVWLFMRRFLANHPRR